MAERKPVTWSGLLNGDTGERVNLTDFPDRTVQFTGTFGAAGTVNFEGTNDGVNWVALTNPQGNALSKTGAALESVTETPRYVRPSVTGGAGGITPGTASAGGLFWPTVRRRRR